MTGARRLGEPDELFEIELDIDDITRGWSIDDVLYYRDLKQRKLCINSQITAGSVEDPIHQILQFNKEDELAGLEPSQRKPITVFITSFGGSVLDGFALIDVIESSKTPVYTINLGYQYSMGFLIGLSGHKRFCFKNSTFLLHEGYSGSLDSTSKMIDAVEFQKRQNVKIKEFILEHTSIDPELYNERLRVEWYMFSDEAKELGIVDYIIGVDCDINEIF